ncbi:hypothetical protein EV209_0367 [Cuneatibacter caecimuris]|uniref:Uncharacterized protein n=1 Tax=Cuneatibacter caecimuris TaxID=1796618 RepID=A0A4V2F857_9FIRM|nr:hypothetical protein EV209_0367 [Cuneatibacter caecimuris]
MEGDSLHFINKCFKPFYFSAVHKATSDRDCP